jgi:REP element-mobilizing transposase RayT
MPDHAHWLLQLGEAKTLPKAVESLKARSARDANQALARTGPLWSRAYHDHGVRTEQDVRPLARYVIANPIRAGLAQRAGDYPYWNASFL